MDCDCDYDYYDYCLLQPRWALEYKKANAKKKKKQQEQKQINIIKVHKIKMATLARRRAATLLPSGGGQQCHTVRASFMCHINISHLLHAPPLDSACALSPLRFAFCCLLFGAHFIACLYTPSFANTL